MNSTTVLQELEEIANQRGTNFDVDINMLATMLDISITSLVSILTELEQRDEIQIEISSANDSQGKQQYYGKVKLMRTPPDEVQP